MDSWRTAAWKAQRPARRRAGAEGSGQAQVKRMIRRPPGARRGAPGGRARPAAIRVPLGQEPRHAQDFFAAGGAGAPGPCGIAVTAGGPPARLWREAARTSMPVEG